MNDVAAIAALQDPVRRRLYDYIAAQDHAVGRAEAADAAGIQRTLAAFHLDRLAEAGLLDVVFRRPAGRGGPGAGRPAKLYRRSAGERAVSVPPRDYRSAARLLAEAVEAVGAESELERIARAGGRAAGAAAASASADTAGAAEPAGPAHGTEPVDDIRPGGDTGPADGTGRAGETGTAGAGGPEGVAAAEGMRPARGAGPAAGPGLDVPRPGGPDGPDGGAVLVAALAARGYEPYRVGGVVRLRNCPFHALATEFPPMVCGMNLAWFEGFLEGAGADGLVARMDPRPGECCVVLDSKNNES